MKKRNQVRKNSSNTAAAPQSKTTQSRANVRPASASASIALFPEGDGISEEIIDLSAAEYAALKRAGASGGSGVLMFMANVALEKIGRRGSPSPSRRGLTVPVEFPDGHVTQVEFNPEERLRIVAALKRSGKTLDSLVKSAVEYFMGCSEFATTLSDDQFIELLGKQTRTRTGQDAFLDLEDSINQAIAFLDLLTERCVNRAVEEGDNTRSASGAGLDKMVWKTANDLHGDYRAVLAEQRKLTNRGRAPVAKAAA